VIHKTADYGNDNVVASKNYQPYGTIIAEYNNSVDDRYDFTEKVRDKETDFNYFGARYYDSDIGRWTSVDPLAEKYPGFSPYAYALDNPLKYFDPDGKQLDDEEDDEDEKEKKNIWNKFLRFISLLSETANISEKPNVENDVDMLINSEEMKGAQILNNEINKAKKATVSGINKVHGIASTSSGIFAIAALVTTSNPETALVAPVLTTTSTLAGIVASSASGLNYAITGETKYLNNFWFESATIGIGVAANSINAGKFLTPENEKVLRQIYKNYISVTSWGIGFGIEK